jgi:hypothetical protein
MLWNDIVLCTSEGLGLQIFDRRSAADCNHYDSVIPHAVRTPLHA